MKIDIDKELTYDGQQFVLTVLAPIPDEPNKATGRVSRKNTFHSTVDQVARKIVDTEVGKTLTGDHPEIKPLVDTIRDVLTVVVMRMKFNNAIK